MGLFANFIVYIYISNKRLLHLKILNPNKLECSTTIFSRSAWLVCAAGSVISRRALKVFFCWNNVENVSLEIAIFCEFLKVYTSNKKKKTK